MAESRQSVFLKIATEKGFLTTAQVETLVAAVESRESSNRDESLREVAVEQGVLTSDQVRGIERGVRYYTVRKADKRYGRIAVELDIIDDEILRNCLNKQKRDYHKDRILTRLPKLLQGLGAITTEEHDAIRQELVRRKNGHKSNRRHAARSTAPVVAVPASKARSVPETNDKDQESRAPADPKTAIDADQSPRKADAMGADKARLEKQQLKGQSDLLRTEGFKLPKKPGRKRPATRQRRTGNQRRIAGRGLPIDRLRRPASSDSVSSQH